MRRRKNGGALLVSLAILAGAWLVTAYRAQLDAAEDSVDASSEAAGYDLSIGTQRELTALSWVWEGQAVNLTRSPQGKWICADDADCPIDNAKAGTLARAAASVSASMAIEGVTEFSQYGLDEPSLVVMEAAGEQIRSYAIGNAAVNGEYYLRMDGGDTVYMEDGGLAAFQAPLTSILDTQSLPGDIAEVTGLSVTTDAQSYSLRLLPDGSWRQSGDDQILDAEGVQALYAPVLATELSDCVGWGELSDYGFDEPQGSAALFYRSSSGVDGSFTLEYGSYDGNNIYVRMDDAQLVYRIPAAALDGLMYPDWESMLPLTVISFDTEAVSSFVLGVDGSEYEILRLTEEEREAVYSMDGWVLDTQRMEAWLQTLLSLTADRAVSSRTGRAELFSLTVNLTSSPEDEEGENLSVTVWDYDSTHALCVSGDRGVLVPREKALALSQELTDILALE